jgi:hypothetical protein
MILKSLGNQVDGGGLDGGDETKAAALTHPAGWPKDQAPDNVLPSPILMGFPRVVAALARLGALASGAGHKRGDSRFSYVGREIVSYTPQADSSCDPVASHLQR